MDFECILQQRAQLIPSPHVTSAPQSELPEISIRLVTPLEAKEIGSQDTEGRCLWKGCLADYDELMCHDTIAEIKRLSSDKHWYSLIEGQKQFIRDLWKGFAISERNTESVSRVMAYHTLLLPFLESVLNQSESLQQYRPLGRVLLSVFQSGHIPQAIENNGRSDRIIVWKPCFVPVV